MAATYYDVYRAARAMLREAGIAAFAQEARLLAAFAAEKTASAFLRDINLYADPGYEEKVLELARRRAEGEPAAYILGAWEFYGLPFMVSPAVLIPRTDTEPLVQAALTLLGDSPARVLDLCCGSGCIGVTIAKNAPATHVVCADISDEAVKLARKNGMLNGVKGGLVCLRADALEMPHPSLGVFDMLLCNPPYIAASEIDTLDSSVKDYEPRLALDGGEDGLKFYRAVCDKWRSVLTPGSALIFECGEAQAAQVRAIGEAAGFKFETSIFDTGKIERVMLFSLK